MVSKDTMDSPENILEFKNEFLLRLRHLEGCSALLMKDAEALNGPGPSSLLEIFTGRIAMERASIVYYFDDKEERIRKVPPEDVKNSFVSPLLEIRGACKDFLKTLQKKNHPLVVQDCDYLIQAADETIDYLEESFSLLFFESSPVRDSSLKGLPLNGEEEPAISAHRGTILIVDDTDMNRILLSQHLGRQGHKILTAASGLEAFTVLHDEAVDLVLLDIMMPGMNGYQVLELLKSDEKFRDIPVVMLSAFEDEKSIIRCIELGAEDYLSKAFNPTFLKARIESSLEKKRLHDQEKVFHTVLRESQKKLFQDLAEAAQYVTSLLPDPIDAPLTVDWRFIPSEQLGGDSFGYHFLDEKRFAVYLLDVSGHGIGAALLSVSVLNMLRNHSLNDADFSDPASVLASLNRKFRMEEQNNMYFTIWYGIFDSESRRLRYSCAGAPPAVLLAKDASGLRSETLKTAGTAIGILDDAKYETEEKPLVRGEKLFLFSDGAFEIKGRDKTIFNLENFIALLVKTSRDAEGKDRSLDSVVNRLREIAVDGRFEDDLSLLEIAF